MSLRDDLLAKIKILNDSIWDRRVSECRSEAAIDAVMDDTYRRIRLEHPTLGECARDNTAAVEMARDRRLRLKGK